jgi:ribose 5-phosphate isomerase B
VQASDLTQLPPPLALIRRLVVGSDHIGFDLKTVIADACRDAGYQIIDVGVHTRDRADYPDVAVAAVAALQTREADLGILVCGTGAGMQIAANRCTAVRAVVTNDLYTAHYARTHNDANLACLGARLVASDLALAIIARFLATPFEAGRHQQRVDKLTHPIDPVLDAGVR